MSQEDIQTRGKLPLFKSHECFERGHSFFVHFEFNTQYSNYGQHKCSRCGYELDWQYDFPSGGNPKYTNQ